jgi:hypothetical protein
MFAAHLAAGLAIRSVQPQAPTWAVLTAAFLPDLLWIGFAATGVESAGDAVFSDGWSHSAASVLLLTLIVPPFFFRLGNSVMIAICAAILSHLLLDLPIHPMPLELWPCSTLVLGVPSWRWGQVTLVLDKSRYWWVQLAITVPLLGFYAFKATREGLGANLVAAIILIILGLHLAF